MSIARFFLILYVVAAFGFDRQVWAQIVELKHLKEHLNGAAEQQLPGRVFRIKQFAIVNQPELEEEKLLGQVEINPPSSTSAVLGLTVTVQGNNMGAPPGRFNINGPLPQGFSVSIQLVNTDAMVRQILERQAKKTVDRFASDYKLEQGQIDKLELAASGDIARFIQERNRAYLECESIIQQTPEKFSGAQSLVRSINGRFQAGIFDDQSLFVKTSNTVVTDQQKRRYAESMKEWSNVEPIDNFAKALDLVDMIALLNDAQREQLHFLSKKQNISPPDLRPDQSKYLGLIQLSKLSKADLTTILSANQLAAVDQTLKRFSNVLQAVK